MKLIVACRRLDDSGQTWQMPQVDSPWICAMIVHDKNVLCRASADLHFYSYTLHEQAPLYTLHEQATFGISMFGSTMHHGISSGTYARVVQLGEVEV